MPIKTRYHSPTSINFNKDQIRPTFSPPLVKEKTIDYSLPGNSSKNKREYPFSFSMSPKELTRFDVINSLTNHEYSLDSSSPPSVMRPSNMT